MGLLSRIGNGFMEQFPKRASEMRGDPWSLGDAATFSAMNAGLGAGVGAMVNDQDRAGGAMAGAALGGLGTAGASMLPKMVKAIAMALKQQNPQVPDEMILQKAMEIAKQQGGGQGGGMMPPMGGMPPGGPGGMGGM